MRIAGLEQRFDTIDLVQDLLEPELVDLMNDDEEQLVVLRSLRTRALEIKKLVDDYRSKGVGFVVIQPNNAEAVRLDEMGYTDLGDSLDDMKIRAEHRRFNFTFVYDGETVA